MRDRYRCPERFLDFGLADRLSRDPGYFQLGPGTICYGRSLLDANQSQPSFPLCDLLPSVAIDKSQALLPFDPTEVIDNLRLERYPSSKMGKYERALKNAYYKFRPLTNRPLRKAVQKIRAHNWQRRQFPEWPVDTTVENICETSLLLSMKASGIENIPFVWFWPNGARGCVLMTHDVETAVGRDFTPQLLDIDDSYGINASLHIVPEERYEVTPQYLSDIRARGFEVCVQDLNHDGRLFDEREEFLRRAALINRYGREYKAKGFRAAVLYRNLGWYEDLDFSFDMSVPNVAHLDPQRGGCCTVMPYFIGRILELPLTTVQDYTLLHVLNERSIALWKTQMAKILDKNGLITFLVHPDYIIEPGPQAVYRELLAELSEMRKKEALWFALPRDADRWWRARNEMSIVKSGKSWRIIGEGAERATLAFAKIRNGKLIYELEDTQQSQLCACAGS